MSRGSVTPSTVIGPFVPSSAPTVAAVVAAPRRGPAGPEQRSDPHSGEQSGQRAQPRDPVPPDLVAAGDRHVQRLGQPVHRVLRRAARRASPHRHVQVGHRVQRGRAGGTRRATQQRRAQEPVHDVVSWRRVSAQPTCCRDRSRPAPTAARDGMSPTAREARPVLCSREQRAPPRPVPGAARRGVAVTLAQPTPAPSAPWSPAAGAWRPSRRARCPSISARLSSDAVKLLRTNATTAARSRAKACATAT